jgi:hypothetical protein
LDAEIAVVRRRNVSLERQILEAGTSLELGAEYSMEQRALPPDWRVVFAAQQRGAIAVYLCSWSKPE